MVKYTNEEWIDRFRKAHSDDKYDYSETDLRNKDDKGRVYIICRKHGGFWVRPSHFVNGHGCKKCGIEKSSLHKIENGHEKFIQRVKSIYEDKYDFSKSIYRGIDTAVEVICNRHGKQYVSPTQIYNGCVCHDCNMERFKENQTYTEDEFISKANRIHNRKYKYSHCGYIGARYKVTIACPVHGDFTQNANSHLNGRGCPKCSSQRFSYMENNEREKSFRGIHGEKYKYNWETYTKSHHPMKIECPIHGEFWQSPSKHLIGNGCPKCNRSHLENEIEQLLIKNNIEYIAQYKDRWLGFQSLDFYLPKYNVAIECQGGQHFYPVGKYGGVDGFERRKKLDNNKLKLCEEHNIKILYFSNLGIEYPYKVFEDKDELLNEIKKG